jgi:hypothetical protein
MQTIARAFNFAFSLGSRVVCVWLPFWAMRRKYELDEELSITGRKIRWIIVIVAFTVTCIVPGPGFALVRVSFGLIGIAFLCWPNFAYRLQILSQKNPTLNTEEEKF